MIDYTYFAESVETRVGPQKHKIVIGQPFPFPGTLKSAGKVALEGIKIAQINHERALRDLIVDLKLSFHEIGYLQRAITMTQQNHKLMQHAVKLANTRYAKDEGTLNDVLKAQSQQAQLAYDLILLRELIEVETAQLNALLDLPTTTPVGKTVQQPMQPLTADYETIEKEALTNRQELLIATSKIEQTKHRIGLARNKNLPSFKASIGTIVTDDADNPAVTDSGKDPVLIGLSMSLPWNVSKNVAAVKEAELTHEAAIKDQKNLENTTRATLRRVYFRLQNSRRLVTLYEKSLIPQAKKSMEISETWEVDGKKNLAGFLETQSIWLNFNLARMRAVTDYNQYLAKL
ncbi:hypothetical protein BVY04_01400, partial [bacterium M21]